METAVNSKHLRPNSMTELRQQTDNTGFDATIDGLLSYIGDEQVTRNVMKTLTALRVTEAQGSNNFLAYPPGVR